MIEERIEVVLEYLGGVVRTAGKQVVKTKGNESRVLSVYQARIVLS